MLKTNPKSKIHNILRLPIMAFYDNTKRDFKQKPTIKERIFAEIMKLTDMLEPLGCQVIHKSAGFTELTIENVTASDLMSDVLVVDQRNLLLVTSLASDQVIRTADIVDAGAVMVVNGKALPGNMLSLARELDMTLLLTKLTKFMACARIGRLMHLE